MNRPVQISITIITLFILCLPVSFFITVLLYPFWSWLENTYNIEAAGHSGPSEWCFWVVYAGCVTIAIIGYFYMDMKKSLNGLAVLLFLYALPYFYCPCPTVVVSGLACFMKSLRRLKIFQKKSSKLKPGMLSMSLNEKSFIKSCRVDLPERLNLTLIFI